MDGADCCGAECRNKLVPSLAPSLSSSLSMSWIASKISLLADSHESPTCLQNKRKKKKNPAHSVMVPLQNVCFKNYVFETKCP